MVLERENLRENDRIMLNTLDMMKLYVDQVKSKEGVMNKDLLKCEKCKLCAQSPEELQGHMAEFHKEQLYHTQSNIDDAENEEEILYCCTKCRYETKQEKRKESTSKRNMKIIIVKNAVLFLKQEAS